MNIKFKQIATSSRTLYGLSEDGTVYRYVPARDDPANGKTLYAMWARLTSYIPEDKTK